MNKKIIFLILPLLLLVTPSVMKHYTYGTVFTEYLNRTMTEKFDNGTIITPPIGSLEYNKHNLPPTEQGLDFGKNTLPVIVTPKLPLLDDGPNRSTFLLRITTLRETCVGRCSTRRSTAKVC
ncbi:MAG: hypothetical protein WBE68_19995 [Candidatus Nitrosopolaris sp.]